MQPLANKGEIYSLATGAAGRSRLDLVEEVYGPEARRTMTELISPSPLRPGAKVADIGCGTGNVACWFAEQVGPSGEVVGIDISADQFAIAAEKARLAGLNNIRLLESGAYETGLPRDHFDLVHARLVLCHVQEPLRALKEMTAITKPGGVVVAFDIAIDGVWSEPPTDAYARMNEIFLKRCVFKRTECNIGPKLPRLFIEAGLSEPEIRIHHPIYLKGEAKRLFEYTLLEGSFNFDAGIMTVEESTALARDLAAVAADETIAIAQAPMFACWARKS